MDLNSAVSWSELVTLRGLLAPSEFSQFKTGNLPKSLLLPLASKIKEISTRYVAHQPGKALASPIRDSTDARAYALYYTPINFAKIRAVLGKLEPDFWRPGLRVLDYGSGPGTGSLAARHANQEPIEVTLVETSPAMRETARAILSSVHRHGEQLSFDIVPDLSRSVEKTFDLIIAANVLTELSDESADELLDSLTQMLSAQGVLVLVEPGQQAQTRRLQTYRDVIVEKREDLTPIFPCPHRQACPMLRESQTDWCHGTLRWERPRLVSALDDLTGYNKHRIKFSCFVFQRGAGPKPGFRLLDNPERGRKGLQAPVCGTGYFGNLQVPKGLPEESYRALRRAEQWDLVQISQLGADGVLCEGSTVTPSSNG